MFVYFEVNFTEKPRLHQTRHHEVVDTCEISSQFAVSSGSKGALL